jgi:hypothetical protein
MAQFEKEFEYPLGEQQTFTISHGMDYLKFFRRMGQVTCFTARCHSGVSGVLTTVQRRLYIPGKGVTQAVYLCDLKVSTKTQSAPIFFQLVKEAREFYQGQDLPAYGVVMHGTHRNPAQYTGAFGIPRFSALGEVAILRIPVRAAKTDGADKSSVKAAVEVFESLNSKSAHARAQNSQMGARYEPTGLLSNRGAACGILTDTLESKRLYSGSTELVSAHLSQFAYDRLEDGIDVVRTALRLCSERDIPALFLSLPQTKLAEWKEHEHYPHSTFSGATIYGLGLEPGHQWNINTSEV